MNKKAFTLLEILLVITLISILITSLIRVINPGQQIADVNNSQRQVDVMTIYTSINQYRDMNAGNLPAGIDTTEKDICQPGCAVDTNKVDISTDLESYIAFGEIPVDPQQLGEDITGYTIYVNIQGRVIVSAPLAENGNTINTLE